jgi:hypothetical protein
MRRTPDPAEERILAALDRLVRRAAVRAWIEGAARRLERRLDADAAASMAWETMPQALCDTSLPSPIRSGWVFLLRACATTGAERHPNSHQRTLSYKGAGDLQTMENGRWRSHRLVSREAAPRRRKWASVPAGTWHQVVVGGRNWLVVSFHTAPAEELIEERPRPDARRGSLRRLYVKT